MKKSEKDPMQVLGCSKGYNREALLQNIKRHKDLTPSILKQINQLPEVVLRNHGNPIAKRIIRMMKEINKEAYRAEQFTRTEINDKGVLYGIVLLKHNVIDIVLRYFHKRWPQCVICLFNEYTLKTALINERGKIYIVKRPLKDVVERISNKRPKVPYFEDIQFSGKKIFETLYKSQNIDERNNPRYFKQMIPDECYDLPGLRNGIEKNFQPRNKKLDEFL